MNKKAVLALLLCLHALAFAQKTPRYSEKTFKGNVGLLEFLGQNTVFLRETVEGIGRIWRSEDEGMTWEDQTQKLDAAGENVYGVQVNPKDPGRAVLYSSKSLWTTKDSGRTYSKSNLSVVYDLKFHPTEEEMLLVHIAAPGCRSSTVGNCFYQLLYSNNFGLNWTFVDSYVRAFAWHPDAGTHMPKEQIYVIAHKNNVGMQPRRSELSMDTELYTSTSFGENKIVLVPRAQHFTFQDPFLFVEQIPVTTNNAIQLLVSKENETVFSVARFPFKQELLPDSYQILDSSTGAAWIAVLPDDRVHAWSDLYLSNAAGSQYVLTSRHVHLGKYFWLPDFEAVGGLEGVYIANTVQNWEDDVREEQTLVTRITFNNGADWRPLQPPNDAASVCSLRDGCSLHLHGYASAMRPGKWEYGPFYTSDSALGLIMATGNTGTELTYDHDEINTYMSRDGGWSWTQVHDGSTLYEFGDHGGLCVLAENHDPTNIIKYSFDEGQSWKVFTFTTANMTVDNIRIEPSTTGRRFILHGTRQTSRGVESVVVGLDFSSVFDNICMDSDYEDWTPISADGNPCLLGHTLVYSRKKLTSQCFNPRTKENLKSRTNCKCTKEDYQCDYGYQHDMAGSYECVSMITVNETIPSICPPGQNFTVSKGHIKIAGDTCEGEYQEYAPTTMTCPDPDTGHKGLAVIVVVCVLIAIIILCLIATLIPQVRAKLTFIEWPSWWDVSGVKYSRLGSPGSAGTSLVDEEDGLGYPSDEEPKELQDGDLKNVAKQGKSGLSGFAGSDMHNVPLDSPSRPSRTSDASVTRSTAPLVDTLTPNGDHTPNGKSNDDQLSDNEDDPPTSLSGQRSLI